MKKLYGVIVAMTTPFTAEGEIDVPALERAVDFQIEKGVNCLYPCGTTGEMFLMTKEQRKLVAETVVRRAAGRVTVFIHCGAMDPCEVVELCNHAHDIGADGTVSGCAGCVPEPFVEVYRCWKAGDLEGAKKAQFTCFDLVKKLRYGADMSIFKHVLDDRGVGGGHAKAPLMDLAEDAVEPILSGIRPYYRK